MLESDSDMESEEQPPQIVPHLNVENQATSSGGGNAAHAQLPPSRIQELFEEAIERAEALRLPLLRNFQQVERLQQGGTSNENRSTRNRTRSRGHENLVIVSDSDSGDQEPPTRRRRIGVEPTAESSPNSSRVTTRMRLGCGPAPTVRQLRPRIRRAPGHVEEISLEDDDDLEDEDDIETIADSDSESIESFVLMDDDDEEGSATFSRSPTPTAEFSPAHDGSASGPPTQDNVSTISLSGSDSSDIEEEEEGPVDEEGYIRWRDVRLVRRNAIVLQDDEDDDDDEVQEVQPVQEVVQLDEDATTSEDSHGSVSNENQNGASVSAENQPSNQRLNVPADTREFLQTVTNPNVEVQVASTSASVYPSTSAAATRGTAINTSLGDDDDGNTCLICYEPYTNSGEHRLACLKCGHTFGKICIEKWIKTSNPRCPQCNSKASKKDIRIIYAKNLKALDTAERDRAMAELEKEKQEKRRLELEYAKLRQKYNMQEQQMQELKLEYTSMRHRVGGIYRTDEAGPSSGAMPKPSGVTGLCYTKFKSLEFPAGSECRVGVFNPWLNMVTISQSSKSPLYPNGLHAIRRLNLLDLNQPIATVPLHQKEIRDLAFSPSQSDTLLSVGLDKRAILTNCNSTVQIQTYNTEAPLWSCAWNQLNQYTFYLGGGNGIITSYDIRKPNQVLQNIMLPDEADKSPIVRLIYINPSYSNLEKKFSLSGLLVQKLNSIWFWEPRAGGDGEEGRFHQLPLEGPFLSMAFEPVSRHVLVSTRAKTGGKHLICDLSQHYSEGQDCNVVNCDIINTYPNVVSFSKMTRTSIFCLKQQQHQVQRPGPEHPHQPQSKQQCNVLVAANALRHTVSIWSISDSSWRTTLNLTEPTLDFIPCTVNSTHLLGTLTSSAIHFFKGDAYAPQQ